MFTIMYNGKIFAQKENFADAYDSASNLRSRVRKEFLKVDKTTETHWTRSTLGFTIKLNCAIFNKGNYIKKNAIIEVIPNYWEICRKCIKALLKITK